MWDDVCGAEGEPQADFFAVILFLWFRSCTNQDRCQPTMNNQPTNTVWMRLRTPALFGAGLYLGLMLFGRESKQGSEYFEGLRGMFEVRAPRSGGRVDTDNGSGGKS